MKNIVPALAGALMALGPLNSVWTLSACSSDGTPPPAALFERFLSADCEACWADPATPAPSAQAPALALDWIAPTAAGDDAPLSAAATRDALERLQALGRGAPVRTDVHVTPLPQARGATDLRVAMGPAFNDYVGAAIAFSLPRAPRPSAGSRLAAWHFYLLLVESVPGGAEGTAVPRTLVRNVLQGTWDADGALSKNGQRRWGEMRSMRIPEGAQAERLGVVGWVQDARGRVVAAAQSVCR